MQNQLQRLTVFSTNWSFPSSSSSITLAGRHLKLIRIIDPSAHFHISFSLSLHLFRSIMMIVEWIVYTRIVIESGK